MEKKIIERKELERKELERILESHKNWLEDNGGERADLTYADLRFVDLRDADLRGADLSYANLREADLSYADLRRANLREADLSYADLSLADLRGVDLRDADLSYANLREADLSGAELNFAKLGMTQIDNSISVGMVGKNKRNALYLYDLDVIYCGCFMGNLEEFEKAVEEKYGDDKMGYDMAIETFKIARRRYIKEREM